MLPRGGGNMFPRGGGNMFPRGGGNMFPRGGGNMFPRGGGNMCPRGGGTCSLAEGEHAPSRRGNMFRVRDARSGAADVMAWISRRYERALTDARDALRLRSSHGIRRGPPAACAS